ncbi:MAG: hypothetical protein PHP42_09255 [Bacteroidota bacterium]|nr:hypothetical protein [Bacteroidota bacterium]
MPPPKQNGPAHNEEIRHYVMNRDHQTCQWPGCGSNVGADVLFLVETDSEQTSSHTNYKNGVTLCLKHMDMVNLHDKAFGPLIFDLIQLVEFENDLQETERVYKSLLK